MSKAWLIIAATLLCAATTLPSVGGPLRERLAAKKVEEERRIDLAAIQPGATVHSEAYGVATRQALDIYVPPDARNAPILVMVHGGAWKIGDKSNTGSVENKLKHWLPQSFIVVSVNYRLLPDAMAYEQARDVAEAMRWVQAHAAGWGGDPNRIVLMGHSAGAHLVALLSSNPDMVGQPWAGTVVLDSAVMKVSDVLGRRHPRFYDEAFGNDPAYWAKTSPMDQWTPAAVPMLLVCSSRRPDHPCDEAESFRALAAKSGKDIPVLPQDLTHSDVNSTLGLPGAYTDAVDAFIAARVGYAM